MSRPKGMKLTEQHRINISNAKKGMKLSIEHKERLSMATKGRHNSVATQFKKGQKFSEEIKKRMRDARNRRGGVPHTLNAKIKISAFQRGINESEWEGFVTRSDFLERKSKEYVKWRTSVFERDNYTCQDCGSKGCYLEAHHIKQFAKYPELRLDINNGLSLCIDCHNKTKKGRPKYGT